MKKINNRWIDDNNNSWSADFYTKEQAEKYSKSLIDCRDCSGCRACRDCSGCRYCSDCSDCIGCSGCHGCSGCIGCRYCSGCSDCRDCSGCIGCRDCSGCIRFVNNPQRYTTAKIGSRKENTTFYWDNDRTLVICGCFRGTVEEFKKQVEEVHGNNNYGLEYKNEIEKVEFLMGRRT